MLNAGIGFGKRHSGWYLPKDGCDNRSELVFRWQDGRDPIPYLDPGNRAIRRYSPQHLLPLTHSLVPEPDAGELRCCIPIALCSEPNHAAATSVRESTP